MSFKVVDAFGKGCLILVGLIVFALVAWVIAVLLG